MTYENQYTALIAGAHRNKPKFKELVYLLTQHNEIERQRLADMQRDFCLDYAIGDQLDALGVRIGVSRELPLRLTGVYFALDDEDGIGLDLGVWKQPYDPDDGITRLDDEIYRAVLKSKVLINHWDGINGTLPELITKILSHFGVDAKVIDLQDYQTMEIAINLTKRTTPIIVWELITRRIIDIVSAGVGVNITDNNPWFGLDYQTASVQGLDGGSWFPFFSVEGGL